MELELNTIHLGDVLKQLRLLPDGSVNCIVTSPPYWGLRDYGVKGQLGAEATPSAYIRKMVVIFREAKRVLQSTGTLWLNIGDSYATNSGSYVHKSAIGKAAYVSKNTESAVLKRTKVVGGLKSKDLVGIPWMLAFALRKDGWFLRQDIIWHKPNPMPESVTDRCTKAHEYIFLFSKSAKYFFDQETIKQPLAASSVSRLSQNLEAQAGSDRVPGKTNGAMKAVGGSKHKNLQYDGQKPSSFHRTRNEGGEEWQPADGKANKRSVWTVATMPFKDAHFATFPEALIVDCIKAGCPEGGVVLDPFFGSGTTGLVARKFNRNFIGIELNAAYIAIAERRLKKELGFFM